MTLIHFYFYGVTAIRFRKFTKSSSKGTQTRATWLQFWRGAKRETAAWIRRQLHGDGDNREIFIFIREGNGWTGIPSLLDQHQNQNISVHVNVATETRPTPLFFSGGAWRELSALLCHGVTALLKTRCCLLESGRAANDTTVSRLCAFPAVFC